MNFTYFKFLFINTIKRKPVWITWLLFLFTCTCFIIILPLAAKMNTLQLWANTTMAVCETFMGMAASIFTAVLAINIFKEGNEEGTELIIISKPISRFTIVLTKFLLFLAICLIVNLTAVLISMFTVFLPRTEVRFYWGLVLSMLIGNAVTFGIFGSIAILMSVNFAKVGVIITNIALSLVFLIYQALTIFVFPIPSKALVDNYMSAPSYICTNRNVTTGDYTEEEFVKFTGAPVTNKNHPCQATNADEMKEFWQSQILGHDPSTALTVTDLAGQVSLSYLSYGLDQYAARQAKRMFAISRFYNYTLTNSASPEIVGNTKSMPWIYIGSNQIELPSGTSIYLPSSFGYCAIRPITVTRLKGYTDKIPVGYVKSKEFLSERDVYFEKDDWQKYCIDVKTGTNKAPFEMLYDNILDYKLYLNELSGSILEPWQYASAFAKHNGTTSLYYKLMWHSLMGTTDSVMDKIDGKPIYGKADFDINSVNDLNDRFIQFKYYAFYRAYEEQHDLLTHEPTETTYAKPSYDDAKAELATSAETLSLNVKYENGWMMKAADGLITVLEPGTQTVSYTLIHNAWDKEQEALDGAGLTEEDQIPYGIASARGIMAKTSAVFDTICYPTEKFLFNSMSYPTRTSRNVGEMYSAKDDWVPYLVTLLGPVYDPDIEKTSCMPIGHNMSYFYYTTTPVINYWVFAVIWGAISLALMVGGVVVYNKYDYK